MHTTTHLVQGVEASQHMRNAGALEALHQECDELGPLGEPADRNDDADVGASSATQLLGVVADCVCKGNLICGYGRCDVTDASLP